MFKAYQFRRNQKNQVSILEKIKTLSELKHSQQEISQTNPEKLKQAINRPETVSNFKQPFAQYFPFKT